MSFQLSADMPQDRLFIAARSKPRAEEEQQQQQQQYHYSRFHSPPPFPPRWGKFIFKLLNESPQPSKIPEPLSNSTVPLLCVKIDVSKQLKLPLPAVNDKLKRSPFTEDTFKFFAVMEGLGAVVKEALPIELVRKTIPVDPLYSNEAK